MIAGELGGFDIMTACLGETGIKLKSKFRNITKEQLVLIFVCKGRLFSWLLDLVYKLQPCRILFYCSLFCFHLHCF